ncbi:hypothetical protein D3C85_634060 [compost metagenome]
MESLAERMLFGDAGEGRREDYDGQADQAHRRQMQSQTSDQPDGDSRLDQQLGLLLRAALGIFIALIGFHDMAHGLWQLGAITEPAEFLHQDAGEQTAEEDGDGDRGHANGKFTEMPARLLTNDEVLGLADQGANTPQGSADGGVHHQAAQKGAELVQVLARQLVNVLVILMLTLELVAGGHLVIDGVETGGDADDHGDHGQGVEEGRQEGRDQAEGEGEQRLGMDADQHLGENVEQQLFHEIDASHHKHQQQQHFDVGNQLMLDLVRRGHADENGLYGQQATGLQRVTLERHGQGEDELDDQQPASQEGIHMEDDRIDQQKYDDGNLVPPWSIAQKILCKSAP